ncbi:MAG: GNAT family N-acetyltransferase [Candidatus Wildermuthbacteria bacterium]|nr:GNAT family N-acetyltransferase [Candidatus Wildermuthbacteria bacterium]
MDKVNLEHKIRKENLRLDGERVYLRPVVQSDATDEYVGWLNDPEINRFLESRFVLHTKAALKEYIQKKFEDSDTVFLAIILKETGRHIGNIKLGPIDWHHGIGDIGIMIGDRESWGKGFATETIKTLEEYAFKVLGLHKLTAGAYEPNIGSIKSFLKAGFFEEGKRSEHALFEGSYINVVLMGKINKNGKN